MKRPALLSCLLGVSIFVLPGFRDATPHSPLLGIWERSNDLLKVEIKNVSEGVLQSQIVENGKEEFPCEVSDSPIYKNIRHIRGSVWSCNFLL